eukprot:15444233-Alexandrium_andersonii.AAC.1
MGAIGHKCCRDHGAGIGMGTLQGHGCAESGRGTDKQWGGHDPRRKEGHKKGHECACYLAHKQTDTYEDTVKQRSTETERGSGSQRGKESERQGGREERQRGREAERQSSGTAERQRGRTAERQIDR